jgi:hypothetical protein
MTIPKKFIFLLFLLLIQNSILPQIKPGKSDTSGKKNSITDSTINKNLGPGFLDKQPFEPSIKNVKPVFPPRILQQSLEYSLMKNMELWNNNFLHKKFFNKEIGKQDYSVLDEQKADLFNALNGRLKRESPELTFIRKYLGISRNAAAFILMIINLIKY